MTAFLVVCLVLVDSDVNIQMFLAVEYMCTEVDVFGEGAGG
jgi:hypothetical protein